MRTLFATVIAILLSATASAQMVGYSVSTETGQVTEFSCHIGGDPYCFLADRTVLGTIPTSFAGPWFAVTAISPAGELVVAEQSFGDVQLVWRELPSLEPSSNLSITGADAAFDIAFGPDSSLWMTGYSASSGDSLYTVDLNTGQATLQWTYDVSLNSITVVGDRLFIMSERELLEFEPETNSARIVAEYGSPNPWVDPLWPCSLASINGQLWSLSFQVNVLGPNSEIMLGTHDLESGDHEVVVDLFDWATGQSSYWWTLDIVESTEQQLPALPAASPGGLVMLVVLIGLAGIIIGRRRFQG